jgi:hypothetical protein
LTALLHSETGKIRGVKTVVEIVVGIVIPVLTLAAVGVVFVWAARKDGEEDQAVQRRLGIKRRTRLGR